MIRNDQIATDFIDVTILIDQPVTTDRAIRIDGKPVKRALQPADRGVQHNVPDVSSTARASRVSGIGRPVNNAEWRRVKVCHTDQYIMACNE